MDAALIQRAPGGANGYEYVGMGNFIKLIGSPRPALPSEGFYVFTEANAADFWIVGPSPQSVRAWFRGKAANQPQRGFANKIQTEYTILHEGKGGLGQGGWVPQAGMSRLEAVRIEEEMAPRGFSGPSYGKMLKKQKGGSLPKRSRQYGMERWTDGNSSMVGSHFGEHMRDEKDATNIADNNPIYVKATRLSTKGDQFTGLWAGHEFIKTIVDGLVAINPAGGATSLGGIVDTAMSSVVPSGTIAELFNSGLFDTLESAGGHVNRFAPGQERRQDVQAAVKGKLKEMMGIQEEETHLPAIVVTPYAGEGTQHVGGGVITFSRLMSSAGFQKVMDELR